MVDKPNKCYLSVETSAGALQPGNLLLVDIIGVFKKLLLSDIDNKLTMMEPCTD